MIQLKTYSKRQQLCRAVKVLVLFSFVLFAQGCGSATSEVLPKGTVLDNLDLSGSPVAEARGKIEEWAEGKLEESHILLYNETEIPVTLKELGFTVETQKVLDDLVSDPKKAIDGVLQADPTKVKAELQDNFKKLNVAPKDASYKIENDQFVVIPAENGRAVDLNKLIGEIQNTPLRDVPARIDIPLAETPAAVTTERVQAMAFDSVIGEYTTPFSSDEKNRTDNLTKAAQALDRKALSPGETLSFNALVGPRDSDTGYEQAKVIRGGEYTQGIGGGVCQVSSTLYNAVLLSNLTVVERKPHAITVSYVPSGQDATVLYPDTDLKFKNDTAGVVYLRAEVASNELTFRIWGKKTDESVRIERQVENVTNFGTERRVDPNLAPGRVVQDQAGAEGMTVNTWKVIRDGAGNEHTQSISRDIYAPQNRIIRVGV